LSRREEKLMKHEVCALVMLAGALGCSSTPGDEGNTGGDGQGATGQGGASGSGQGGASGSGQGGASGSGQGGASGSGQGGTSASGTPETACQHFANDCQLQPYDVCLSEASQLTAEQLACVEASSCDLLAQGTTVCSSGAGGSSGSGAGGSSGDACAQAGGSRAPGFCPSTCSSGGRCANFQFPTCSALYGWCEHASVLE
jgi:hypothetical protein